MTRLPKYTSIGSYPLFYLHDHEALCPKCASDCDDIKESEAEANFENHDLYCDECSVSIEAAY